MKTPSEQGDRRKPQRLKPLFAQPQQPPAVPPRPGRSTYAHRAIQAPSTKSPVASIMLEKPFAGVENRCTPSTSELSSDQIRGALAKLACPRASAHRRQRVPTKPSRFQATTRGKKQQKAGDMPLVGTFWRSRCRPLPSPTIVIRLPSSTSTDQKGHHSLSLLLSLCLSPEPAYANGHIYLIFSVVMKCFLR